MAQRVAKNILVTGYVNPDLDAYACAAGYSELLNLQGLAATPACFGQAQNEIVYTLNLLDEPLIGGQIPDNFDSFVIVDTSDALHLPAGISTALVEEVIDHHTYNDPAPFTNAKLDIQPVGAAATLVAERYAEAGITPRRQIAGLLYAAIISNTLNFKASVTTNRDREVAAWLGSIAALPDTFGYDLFKFKADVTGDKLRQLVELEMSPLEVQGAIFIIGALELTDVSDLLAGRRQEIEELMHELHSFHGSHVTFLSLSDVHAGKTFFVTPYPQIQTMLATVLKIEFYDNVAEYPTLILRKEYVGRVRQQVFEHKAAATAFRPKLSWHYLGLSSFVSLAAAPLAKISLWLQDNLHFF